MNTLYTVQEIADLMHASSRYIRKYLTTKGGGSTNRILAYKVGGQYRIHLDQPYFIKCGFWDCFNYYLNNRKKPRKR
jgi:excisionase family DNA binding protein